jgi:FG-GAP repeat
MKALRLFAVSIFLCICAVHASDVKTPRNQSALSTIALNFPYLKFIWSIAEGDLNGDGVPDLAVVVTGSNNDGPREERLFVLAGNPDGSYRVISVSNEFCHVSKFYELDIRKNSVFVQAYEYADAARASSYTLQFRYNAKFKDLVFVGEETRDESYNDGSYYRVSMNYLTKTVVHTRQAGKRHKEAKGRLNNAAILRLQGFDCSNRGPSDSSVYIDEKFKLQNR